MSIIYICIYVYIYINTNTDGTMCKQVDIQIIISIDKWIIEGIPCVLQVLYYLVVTHWGTILSTSLDPWCINYFYGQFYCFYTLWPIDIYSLLTEIQDGDFHSDTAIQATDRDSIWTIGMCFFWIRIWPSKIGRRKRWGFEVSSI